MGIVATHSQPAWGPFKYVSLLLDKLQRSSMEAGPLETEDRARRDFVLEMMQANPDAIQHEIGYQIMMQFFPSRF